MKQPDEPIIPANQSLPELSFKVICLSVILAVILAASNTYLALKIGILTSASIPAAILSMGILRLFKESNILQNNLVQTAASAGEAVAGGIVYTIPALIIIHYWTHFAFWKNFAIAFTGGLLGVLFSIPLRRVLMTEPNLRFPEGKAIAEVLHMGEKKTIGFKQMLMGGAAGGLLELAQTGFQIIASTFQKWFIVGKAYVGFGAGFSATLIGAGYLIGFRIGVSILLGAIIGWLIAMPILSYHIGNIATATDTTQAVMNFWSSQVRYVGIGAMLTAGGYTLANLIKPFCASMAISARAMHQHQFGTATVTRTEHDIPMPYVISGILLVLLALYGLLRHLFHYQNLNLPEHLQAGFLIGCLLYILVIGFIFAAICGYFSGLVGVTASPGSAIVIAGLLLAALLIRSLLSDHLSPVQLNEASAITIILGAIITGIACIANDNIQDLKVGHLVGSTPWKQQIMLMIGVCIAATVIPPVMELLFNVYGIADVLPHAGMDPSKTLAAPPAAMMAAIAQAVFSHQLPWDMLILGGALIIPIIIINTVFRKKGIELSLLAVAIGVYLPLTSSVPLFAGALFAWLNQQSLSHQQARVDSNTLYQGKQKGVLLACGLVSGAALMDVLLAIPFAISHNAEVLRIIPLSMNWLTNIIAPLCVLGLGVWFHKVIKS